MIGHLTTSILNWYYVWLHKLCHASFLISDQWLWGEQWLTYVSSVAGYMHILGGNPPTLSKYCIVYKLTLFPHLPHIQFTSTQKQREKAWEINLSTAIIIMSSHLRSTANIMYWTDLVFCTSYEDGARASRELHWVYETSLAKSHDSKGLLSHKS